MKLEITTRDLTIQNLQKELNETKIKLEGKEKTIDTLDQLNRCNNLIFTGIPLTMAEIARDADLTIKTQNSTSLVEEVAGL